MTNTVDVHSHIFLSMYTTSTYTYKYLGSTELLTYMYVEHNGHKKNKHPVIHVGNLSDYSEVCRPNSATNFATNRC